MLFNLLRFFMCKLTKSAALFVITATLAGPSFGSTVNANGSGDVNFQGGNAYDSAGNFYNAYDYLTFSGNSHIQASSTVSAPNAVASTPTITQTYTITNNSVDVFIDWLADFQLLTLANGSGGQGARGEYYYDSNTYITVGGYGSFASVNGTYNCTVLNPNDPAYDCDGYSSFFIDPIFGSDFGTLNPGDSISFTLTAQSFATQRFVAAVPLPATYLLLAIGLLGLVGARHLRVRGVPHANFGMA
jgi:PEP-CTERM motif